MSPARCSLIAPFLRLHMSAEHFRGGQDQGTCLLASRDLKVSARRPLLVDGLMDHMGHDLEGDRETLPAADEYQVLR